MDYGTFTDSDAVLAEIRRRVPGATMYVSPLADFERPETCQKQDINNSRRLVNHLVATGGASRGPVMPFALDEWIQPPAGNVQCGAGIAGRAAFGAALAAFDWGR